MVAFLATQDFRRHIGQGARKSDCALEWRNRLRSFAEHLPDQAPRQTEIEHLDQAFWTDNDMAAFQVPMNQAAAVGWSQSPRHLHAVRTHGLDGRPAPTVSR